MFNGGEAEIRSVVGGNTHEKGGSKVQQGGTGMLLYGGLIDQYDFEASGKDETGLGRWVHMVLQGEDGIRTRFVCGYNPCPSGKRATKSSYQQHRRYFIRKERDRTCPRTRFRQDLIRQLVQWRKEGNRLVVCLDANGNIYNKKLGRDLASTNELEMVEVVGNFTGQKVGPTFFRGKEPIDSVWATPDVVITGACVMPVGYGVGDHRMFVIDFLTSSLIGCNPPKIVRAAARRLSATIPGVEAKYVSMLRS